MERLRSKRRILGGVIAVAAASLLAASPAAAHQVRFVSFKVTEAKAARNPATGQTTVKVSWDIRCEGANQVFAGIGFGDTTGEIWTIVNGKVNPQGSAQWTGTLQPGLYVAGTAYVRCVSTKREEPGFVGKHVHGAYPPKNPGAAKQFVVR